MKKNIALLLVALSVSSDGMASYYESIFIYPIVNIAKSYSLRLLNSDDQMIGTIAPLTAKNVTFPVDPESSEEDIYAEALDKKNVPVTGKVKIPANPGSTKKKKTKLKTPGSLYAYEIQVGYFATGVSGKPTIRVTPLDETKYRSRKYPNLTSVGQVAPVKAPPSTSSTSAKQSAR